MDYVEGEDYVELIMAIESAFEISISDYEAESVSTVGELHGLIITKLAGKESDRCLSSVAFYRLRRGMVEGLGVDRSAIRPSTSLEILLPRKGRRAQWQRIAGEMNLRLPGLEYSRSVRLTLLAVGCALTAGAGVYAGAGLGGLVLFFVLGLFPAVVLMKTCTALAVEFPNSDATVGDLARDVLADNHGRLISELGTWSRRLFGIRFAGWL